MKKLLVLTLVLMFGFASVAIADDMNEYFVAGALSDVDWAAYYATSSMSLQQAEQMAIAKCGNTQFCKEHVYSFERGCVGYAESPDAWGVQTSETVDQAVSGAVMYCNNESPNSPCKPMSVWCSDR